MIEVDELTKSVVEQLQVASKHRDHKGHEEKEI